MKKSEKLNELNSEYWENAYIEDRMGWDLGGPTPVFNDWIDKCNKQLSICVLGAGNGWDAINFAERGHIVTAVDFAPSAINNMKRIADDRGVKLNLLNLNIFNLDNYYENFFDVVIEYTCFCAISPSNRDMYLNIVKNILNPFGEFVALLFPIDKNPDLNGPPFGLNLEMTINHISNYLLLIYFENPELSIKPRLNREVFVKFKKI